TRSKRDWSSDVCSSDLTSRSQPSRAARPLSSFSSSAISSSGARGCSGCSTVAPPCSVGFVTSCSLIACAYCRALRLFTEDRRPRRGELACLSRLAEHGHRPSSVQVEEHQPQHDHEGQMRELERIAGHEHQSQAEARHPAESDQLHHGVPPAEQAGHVERKGQIERVAHPHLKDPADPFAGFSDTLGQRRVIQPQKIIQKEEREKGSASDKRKRRGPALLASVLGPQGSSPIGPEDQNAGPHHHGFSSPIDLMNERRDRRQTEKAIGGGKNLVIEPSGDPEEVARY